MLWIRARESATDGTLPATFAGRVIEVGGQRMRILERGAGPALILVAGTGGSVANWPSASWSDSPATTMS